MSSDITVEKVISKLTSRFQPDAAKGMSSVFQFVLDHFRTYFIFKYILYKLQLIMPPAAKKTCILRLQNQQFKFF